MNYRKPLSLIAIITFLSAVMLGGLTGLAQAASTVTAGRLSPVYAIASPLLRSWDTKPAPVLPAAIPPGRPLLTGNPVLTITKSSTNEGGAPLLPGERITYTIVLSNSGDVTATNVVVSDTIPANTTFDPSSFGITPPEAGGTSGAQPILAEGITINPTSSVTITYAVTVASGLADGTVITNTAAVTSAEVADPQTSITTDTVINQADLSITKTSLLTQAVPGQTITYTIVVANNSSTTPVTDATVTDNFPADLTAVSWSCAPAGGGSCTAFGNGNINDSTVDLPINASVTYLVTGTVSAGATGLLTNTASVTVPGGVTDPSTGNNSAVEVDPLTPRADLSLTKTSVVTQVVPGTSVTYTIIAANSGGPSDVSGATVADTFPGALTGVSWTCSGAGGGSCPASGSGNIGTTVNLPVNASVTYLVTGTVSAGATGLLTNTASVTVPGGVTDPSTGNNSAVEVDPLTPRADLSLTKTSVVTQVVPGTSVTYTIIAANSGGPSDVSGATVADTFPGALTGVSWTCSGAGGGSCPASGSGNIGTTVNLPINASVTYLVTGTVSAGATGLLTNTASVTVPGGVTDPSTGNNSAVEVDPLTPRADLSLTKTSVVTQVVPGTSVTYTIIAANSGGPSDVSGATVADTFPGALTGVSWTCSGAGGGSCPASGSGNIGTTVNLPVNASVTYLVTGTVSAGATGLLTNTASITVPAGTTDPIPANNSATESDPLTPRANLSISKTDNVSAVVPGASTTYTIVVSNTGPSNAPNTLVTDNFPSATNISWTCAGSGGGTCPASGTTNLNTAVNLPAGGSVTFNATITVNPGARGALVNTASLTAPAGVTDTTPGNNSATDSDTLTPQANLIISKSDSPGTVSAGDLLTYTINIVNVGLSNRTQVQLTDNLPAELTFLSSTPGSPTCGAVNNSFTCDLGTIVGGGSVSVTVRVQVKSSTPAGTIINTAIVDGTDNDFSEGDATGDNIANEFTTIQVRPDLTITKLESADPVALGQTLTYTLRITNNGPSDAPQVIVNDDMPNGMPFGPISTSQGSCTTTDPITCTLGSMVRGAVAIVTIPANPAATGALLNSATVSVSGGGTVDPVSGNNSSSASTTINRVTDLALSMTDSPDPVTAGSNLTYNLTVVNHGPSPATSVTMTHTLPPAVTFQTVSPTAPTCTHSGGVVTCNLGAMNSGSSIPISVVVRVNDNAAGNITSTASVTATSSTGPDTASATTFVGILKKVYLPFLEKPAPTDLSVFNDNTKGVVTFTVLGTGVSCTVPNNTTQFCGSFSPGVYTVQVTSACGNATTTKSYSSGPQTTRVFCQ